MSGAGAADYLRVLGSGTGAGVGPGAAAGRRSIEGAGFDALLTMARGGELGSSKPVRVDATAGIELSEQELAKVALATDQASASGARRVLVMLGSRALEVDVVGRRVVGEVDLSTPGAVTGIDAIVRADAASVGGAVGPGRLPGSASLLKVLGEIER